MSVADYPVDQELSRQFDRMPPADIEAERCVLASIMVEPDRLEEVRAIITRDSLYLADHQIIWDVICALRLEGTPVDAVTVRAALSQRKLLDEIGGVGHIAEILASVPSAIHAIHYAKIVREKAALRNVIRIGNDMIQSAYAPSTGSVADTICQKGADLLISTTSVSEMATIHSIADVMLELADEFDNPDKAIIPTGLIGLDEMMNGLLVGGVTLIAGQPSMGKSALAKEITMRVAAAGHSVGVISVEEKRTKIAGNYISNVTSIENRIIRKRCGSESQLKQIYGAMPGLSKLPIWFADTAQRISEIEAAASKMVAKCGCKVIVVDHLHLINGREYKAQNRTIEVGMLSTALKLMASRLNVALLELAQLNRQSETGVTNHRPTIAMLRDSGTVAQDADTIMLLYREDYYKQADRDYRPTGKLEVIFGKQRDGECGIVPLKFEGRYQRISEWLATDECGYGAGDDGGRFG